VVLAVVLAVVRGAAPVPAAVLGAIFAAGFTGALAGCFGADTLPVGAVASLLFVELVCARVAMADLLNCINGLYCLCSLMLCRTLGKQCPDLAHGPTAAALVAGCSAGLRFADDAISAGR
jgi:hypothetical protein